jgi:hypothetical protein
MGEPGPVQADQQSAPETSPGGRETAVSRAAMLSSASLEVALPGRGSITRTSSVLSQVTRFGQCRTSSGAGRVKPPKPRDVALREAADRGMASRPPALARIRAQIAVTERRCSHRATLACRNPTGSKHVA